MDEHEASSVCEQRNAALVRMTLEGERKRGCELGNLVLVAVDGRGRGASVDHC